MHERELLTEHDLVSTTLTPQRPETSEKKGQGNKKSRRVHADISNAKKPYRVCCFRLKYSITLPTLSFSVSELVVKATKC